VRRAPVPSYSAVQSTATPRAKAAATAAVTVRSSARPVRSRDTAVTASGASTEAAAIAEQTASGPSSRNVVTPSASMARTASMNRTGRRTWSTQYSGEDNAPSVTTRPVTVETTGTCGAWKVSCRTTARNSSCMGSMSGEWKAWPTFSRLTLRPSRVAASATARTALSTPATTTARGPFTAARSTSA
jgi:hypothetical protein